MHSYNKDIGSFGEALARDYLISKGYKILNMNFRNKFGEIDITCYKQKQIIKLSELYLISKKYYNFNVRYDIIEVIFNTITSSHIINHVQDAFRAY